MNTLISWTTAAAVAVLAAVFAIVTGCGPTDGTVVDKGVRITVVGKQRQPCYWIKVRDDSGTNTTCISARRWKKIRVGQNYGG